MSFERIAHAALIFCGLAMFAYHMISSQVVLAGYIDNQVIHLGFVLTLIFLDAAIRDPRSVPRVLNLGAIAASPTLTMADPLSKETSQLLTPSSAATVSWMDEAHPPQVIPVIL